MTRAPLNILSYTATGVVIPHTLTDVQRALARMGHRVWVQDLARLGGTPERITALIDGLLAVQPDLVFTIDHVGILPEVIPLLAPPPRVVSWFYDDPLKIVNETFLSMNSAYRIFCWDRAYVPELKRRGFAHVEFQPFATDPEIYRPEPAAEFKYDVSFVGRWSPEREEVLRALAANGIATDVFGDDGWTRAVGSAIRYHGIACNRRDCPLIYARSKINLNLSSRQQITSLPVRVFDVLAAGGFLLTDHREDLDRLFVPGRDLIVFDDVGDLARKIRFHLERPEERSRIARQGREIVSQRHTFDRVLPSLLERALADGPAAENRVPPLPRLAGNLWLVGLGYLKCGKADRAGERIIDALRLCPRDENALLAAAFFGHRTGQPVMADACADALAAANHGASAALAREWALAARRGESIRSWDVLYRRVFPSMAVSPAGRVIGWEPQRMGSPQRECAEVAP